MTIIQSAILGLIQGITEFLPISSTGHLILARDIMNIQTEGGLMFDAVLHLATLAAVAIYFRREIRELIRTAWLFVRRKPISFAERYFLGAVVIGTVPAALAGFFLENTIESYTRNGLVVAAGLLIGSLIMLIAEKYAVAASEMVTPRRGLVIGLFQALALFPGISRSGATISGGLFQKLSRGDATRFAFVLSFPILFGGGMLSLVRLIQSTAEKALSLDLLVGSLFALVFGILSIRFLVGYLKRHSLSVFIWYRIILAVVVFLFWI